MVRLHTSDEGERLRLRRDVIGDPASFDVAVTTYVQGGGSRVKRGTGIHVDSTQGLRSSLSSECIRIPMRTSVISKFHI